MSIEAMKQALEALEYIENNYMSLPKKGIEAITSLRQAIKQAEKQEPVLWKWKDSEMVTPFDKTNVEGWTPLYTTPQPQRFWVGLTDEEILEVSRGHYNPHQRPEISFAHAIEAKLKEKNT